MAVERKFISEGVRKARVEKYPDKGAQTRW